MSVLTQSGKQPEGTAIDHSCFSSIERVSRTQIAGKSSTILQTNPSLVGPRLRHVVERERVKVRRPHTYRPSPYLRLVPILLEKSQALLRLSINGVSVPDEAHYPLC